MAKQATITANILPLLGKLRQSDRQAYEAMMTIVRAIEKQEQRIKALEDA